MRKRIALWAFVVAGLALTVWGIFSYLYPNVECRGETMAPGDMCHYSSRDMVGTDLVQTYDDRIDGAREQTPFVIGLGVIVTGFGAVVALRSGREGHGAVDDPVLLHEGHLSDAKPGEVLEEER